LISISAGAVAQEAVVSKTSLLHVAQYVFCDIDLASKLLFSDKKGAERGKRGKTPGRYEVKEVAPYLSGANVSGRVGS
jgi:hypothetical protein